MEIESPQNARMPQLLELDDSLVALDDLGPHRRLAKRLRALGQTHEAVKLGDDLDDIEPGAVVLVELAVDLLKRSIEVERGVGRGGEEERRRRGGGGARSASASRARQEANAEERVKTYLVLEVVDDGRFPFPRLLELRNETSDLGRPVAVEGLGARHLGPVARHLDLGRDFELYVQSEKDQLRGRGSAKEGSWRTW
jgi:hypothetical protein